MERSGGWRDTWEAQCQEPKMTRGSQDGPGIWCTQVDGYEGAPQSLPFGP